MYFRLHRVVLYPQSEKISEKAEEKLLLAVEFVNYSPISEKPIEISDSKLDITDSICLYS
jgi:hypothetical protein